MCKVGLKLLDGIVEYPCGGFRIPQLAKESAWLKLMLFSSS